MTVVYFPGPPPALSLAARMGEVLCRHGLFMRSASPIERAVGYITLRLHGFPPAEIVTNFELAIRAARLAASVPSLREGGNL